MRVSNSSTSFNWINVVFVRSLLSLSLSPLYLHHVLLLKFKSNVKWKFALFSVCYSHIKSRRENKRKWCIITIFITLREKNIEETLWILFVSRACFFSPVSFCYQVSRAMSRAFDFWMLSEWQQQWRQWTKTTSKANRINLQSIQNVIVEWNESNKHFFIHILMYPYRILNSNCSAI